MPVRPPTWFAALAHVELLRNATASQPQAPYTGTLEDYIRSVCPGSPWSPHSHRLVDLAQRVADALLAITLSEALAKPIAHADRRWHWIPDWLHTSPPDS